MLIHTLVMAAVVVTLWVYGAGEPVSFLIGGVLTLANVGALYWIWDRIFKKKGVALAASVIVLKYAFLILVIFGVTTLDGLSGLWFGLGFASVGLTSVIWALIKSKT